MRSDRSISKFGVVAVACGLAALVATAGALNAQQPGRILGRVVDSEGAPVIGARIELADSGSNVGSTSGVDGRFVLAPITPGTVSIRARMVGYQPKIVSGIEVRPGATVEQNVTLTAAAVQLAEVEVTAEAERGSVNRALEEQRNANNIVNAITAEQIAKSPDSDAGQAIQRVSGVTVQDGKFVYVRGLGERYTTTELNGSRIPSPEPDRKIVPLDLFPSVLLEGITTSKTFTPEQPGDFSGASVNIKTKEFPARRIMSLSVGAGFNDAAAGENVVKAPTVGGEWLAYGLGPRQLPDPVRAAGNLSGVTLTQANQLIGTFRDAWSAGNGNGAANGSTSISVGGEDPVFGQRIGYLGSFSYQNDQEVRKDETRGLAKNGTEPGTALPLNTYQGSSAKGTVLWGGLLNLSTRLGGSSRLSFNNAYTRGGDNEASVLTGFNEEFSNNFEFQRLTYTTRSVRSNQLQGQHLLSNRISGDWSVTWAGVTRDEPDRSDIGYLAVPDPTSGRLEPREWFGAPRFATRTFTDMSETSWDFGANVRFEFGGRAYPTALKIGGAFRTVSRDADSRAYDITNLNLTDAQRQMTPEQIFTPANESANSFFLSANTNGGRYTADDKVAAGYVQLEIPITHRLQFVGGARIEDWHLDVNTVTPGGQVVPSNPRNTDVLPGLALNYRLTPNHNLRFSASQTLSRPEYRELSPVVYFEQVGFFTTIGNPDLKRALIQNFDLRWEWFPNLGEVVSVGVFAKRFKNPIEKVIVQATGTNQLSYVNAEKAENYGVELELRKNLGFVGTGLLPFTLFANTTLMKSDITPGNTGLSALTNPNRPMVGQSEYVVNAGLTASNNSGRWTATVLYNVAGERILEAGSGGLPDAYEQPRNLLDVSAQLPVTGNVYFKLEGKNLLNEPFKVTQGDVVRWSYLTGRVFKAILTLQLL